MLDAIRNYTYHLDEVTDKPVSEIVTIFNLVNSSGTDLSSADLALARICVGWPEAREVLRASREHFEAAGFPFKLEFFTRCISAISVANVYFEGGFDQVKADDLKAAWDNCEHILEYLVNILRNDAFIDSSETLSTPYVLIPILVYLSRNKKVFRDDEEKRWFLYWMYLALMWGRYSGSTDTALQADVNALSEEDYRARLISNLVQKHGRVKVQPEDLEGQGTTSRFYPLTYIVARSEGAVDWFTGVKLYNSNIGKSYGLEDHHIFPQSVLYKNGYNQNDSKQKKMVNELANRAFLTKKANLRASNAFPSKYLPEVKAKHPKALMHQFVPENSKLWEVEKYPQFLRERRKLIAAGINGFLGELLARTEKPEEADEQISRFIASGESEKLEFKSSLRWDYVKGGKNKDLETPIMKTIAGFLNAKGGTLLIGVSPKGEILGLQNDYETFSSDPNRDGFEQRLTQLIGSRLGKEFIQFVATSFTAIEGKDVCWVQVESSPHPVYVEDANDYKFFVRLGNTTQLLNAKEMTEFLSMKSSSATVVAAGN